MKLENCDQVEISSLGGSDTVTGSCTSLKVNDQNYLIDAGLFQGEDESFHKNKEQRVNSVESLKAVFLTHAHLDHCGYLPRLAYEGFSGPIFCTSATRDLAELVMKDAASILQEEAKHENKGVIKTSRHLSPLYRTQDVQRVLNLMRVVAFGREQTFNNLRFTFHPAGHIPGASSLSLTPSSYPQCKMLFSGDLGRTDDLLMRPPEITGNHNVIFIEATYGNRLHPSEDSSENFQNLLPKLISQIKKTGSTLLIPSFSIARSQMVLFLLKNLMEKNPTLKAPIYMDSPMGLSANTIFLKHHEQLKIGLSETKELFDYFMPTKRKWSQESRQKRVGNEPQILISSSGMMTGGKVLEHFKNLSTDKNNIVYFPGYLGRGTLGKKIVDKAVPYLCEVYQAKDLSSHADQVQLLEWLKKAVGKEGLPPQNVQVYINHGALKAREKLKEVVKSELGFTSELLNYNE